jgi:hypothetical protein
MVASNGDYLHNFAFIIQDRLKMLNQDFIYFTENKEIK